MDKLIGYDTCRTAVLVLQEIRSYQGMQLHNQDEVLYYQKREPVVRNAVTKASLPNATDKPWRLRRSTTMLYYCNPTNTSFCIVQ